MDWTVPNTTLNFYFKTFFREHPVYFLQVGAKHLHEAAQRLRPKTAAELHAAVGPSSLKFLVVRHPFHRIASAYVDKFEIGQKNDYIFRTFNK